MAVSFAKILDVKGISKSYNGDNGSVRALSQVDISLNNRETLAVLGPTGCGKSTLLLHLAGLLTPTEGKVFFKDSILEKPHRDIALVLQEYGLFPWKNVLDNVELGLKIRKEKFDKSSINKMLENMGILDKIKMYPQQLSGGQKQRVALARALVLNPSLLLLDEPFAALDTLTRERLQDLLIRLWAEHHFAMVIVTHNIQEAVMLGQRILIMDNNTSSIKNVISNETALSENYRGSDSFYQKARELRLSLEDES